MKLATLRLEDTTAAVRVDGDTTSRAPTTHPWFPTRAR